MTKTDKFYNLVSDKAKSSGCEFFLSCGEGNDFETDEMKGENLFGWLIPAEKVADFLPLFQKDSISDSWNKFQRFVIWHNDRGKISIEFTSE